MAPVSTGWSLAEPRSPEVSLGGQSKYVPLSVPQAGDINQVLVRTSTSMFSTPDQFMLVLGNDLMRIALKAGNETLDDISLVLGAEALEDLVEKIKRTSTSDAAKAEACHDVVVRYRVFAREFGGDWVECLHGPLTFSCEDSTDATDADGITITSPVDPGNPEGGNGPFDGNYAPAFLAADAVPDSRQHHTT